MSSRVRAAVVKPSGRRCATGHRTGSSALVAGEVFICSRVRRRVRVVSLLPSCTEVLFRLGIRPVGVSHSCDHPPVVTELPTVTSTPVEYTGRSAGEIDAQMQAVDGAVYDLHTEQVAALDPDLMVTQAECDVCAVNAS